MPGRKPRLEADVLRMIPVVLAVLALLPMLSAQTVTRPWNQQTMSGTGAYGAHQMGYEFEVAIGGEVPEVTELGAALPINTYAGVTGATVQVGKAKVGLWEVHAGGTTGTKLAGVEVDASPTWAWKTLPTPITLTPGKRYRVCVLTKVVSTITPTGGAPIQVTDTNCYFYHSSGLTPLTVPTAPITFIDGCLADNGTWPGSADENMFPDQVGAGQPWGMADIGWRAALVSPVLAQPSTLANVSGVLVTECGPDIVAGGHEGGEIQNVSSAWQDISGWKIVIYDSAEATAMSVPALNPLATGVIPQGTQLAPGQIFTFGESTGGSAFQLAFGSWNWALNSASAVVLLDAANTVMDVVRINSIDLAGITQPVGGLAAHWSGVGLAQWNTTNSWQRGGDADYDSNTYWVRTNGRNPGTSNPTITLPFAGAGRYFPAVSGTDPSLSATLQVGHELKLTFAATDGNLTDTLALTVTHTGGLDPVQAGLTNLTAGTPAVVTGGNSVQFTLNGVAAMAGTMTLTVSVSDQTARTDSYTLSVTISAAPNFTPVLSVSYDNGAGRTPIATGTTFGTSAQPVGFGVALSAYALQITANDGNGNQVAVSGALSLNPTSAQTAMAGADFDHAAQAASYMYSPNGAALFAHVNQTQCTFTVTLTAADGQGGSSMFVMHFVVAAAPANAAPAISVSRGGVTVANGGTVVVSPNDTVAGLALQITINDANNEPVRLVGTVSNVTSQGILDAEFSSGGYVMVSYTRTPSSGVFSVPGVVHAVSLLADDNHWLGSTSFSFNIVVNRAPTLSVTANGAALQAGGTVAANYMDTLASLSLAITCDDPDGNPTAVSATVTGVSTQGFGAANFSHAAQAVAYGYQPTGGTFNVAAGSSHAITLTATDSYGGQAGFTFTISANPHAPVIVVGEQGGGSIANGSAPSGGRDFGTLNVNSGASAPLVVEIGNTGSGPLQVISVSLSGPNASDFSVQAGALPASVTPAAPYAFQVRFDPVLNGLKQATVTMQYQAAGPVLTYAFEVQGQGLDPAGVHIDTLGLPNATTATHYATQQLMASGGVPAYSWSLFSGVLPGGLTLSPQGELGGNVQTGWQTGDYVFTARVTDAAGATDEKQFTLTVVANPNPVVGVGSGGGGGCAAQAGEVSAMALLLLLVLGGGVLFRRKLQD